MKQTVPDSYLMHGWASHTPKTITLKRHKRAWIIDSFELEEELPGPYPKLLGTVNMDQGEELRYQLRGKGVDEAPKGLFHINEDNGNIYVHSKVDYEETPVFHWQFNAINRTTNKLGTRLGIQLKVLDINDNAPEFSDKSYKVPVNESCIQGNTIHTVLAYDKDDHSSPNSLVHYSILSQTPADKDTEFTIHKEKGFISFKGCLNYERNKSYKLIVKANDNGLLVQQSSTCEILVSVLDRNTHAPEWSTDVVQITVAEREEDVTVLRLSVTDEDTPYTPAWRAVYSIPMGNDNGNFKITTDPKTNEGLLTIVKALDYEMGPQNNLSISVSNEEPLFYCKILKRTPSGLWEVETSKNQLVKPVKLSKPLLVNVKDVNDPPKFTAEKTGLNTVEHSIKPGAEMGTIKATDTDIISPNKIKYYILNDPADWLSIDEDTGVLTCKAELDRESDFVTNSKYNVTVLAVDDGEPSMTGSTTFIINLKDINDNVPTLESPYITTCENEEEVIITTPIIDKDLDPYTGPFHISVIDKDIDKMHIKLMETNGDVVKVLKLKDAHRGNHTLHLEIYDRQASSSLQNLTIYVCDCLEGGVCVEKMNDPPALGGGATALLLLVPVLFLVLCFMMCKIKRIKAMVPVEHEPLNSMIAYNEESENKDCQASAVLLGNAVGTVPIFSAAIKSPAVVVHNKVKISHSNSQQGESFKGISGTQSFDRSKSRRHSGESFKGISGTQSFDRSKSRRHSVTKAQHYTKTVGTNSIRKINSKTLDYILKQKLSSPVDDLVTFKPRLYAMEGEISAASSFETISISGSEVHLEKLLNLGSKFNILEEICMEHMLEIAKEGPPAEEVILSPTTM
ncbi:cadherin-like protein 26 [Rhinophrynus dorsalis]